MPFRRRTGLYPGFHHGASVRLLKDYDPSLLAGAIGVVAHLLGDPPVPDRNTGDEHGIPLENRAIASCWVSVAWLELLQEEQRQGASQLHLRRGRRLTRDLSR